MPRQGFVYQGPCGATRVVECDPFPNHPFGYKSVSQLVQIDGLLFQRSPEALDKDVIEITPTPVH